MDQEIGHEGQRRVVRVMNMGNVVRRQSLTIVGAQSPISTRSTPCIL